MKQLKSKMLASTLATALVLGGSFAGTVHNAYADEAAAAAATQNDAGAVQNGAGATQNDAAATASADTIGGVPIPTFAKLHGVDLRLGKAALSTVIILGEDLQDVYNALTVGQSLASQGGANYWPQLFAMTQANIDAAVASGNITSEQGTQLADYASRILKQEINDANYRDNDNSSGDPIASVLLSTDADSADIAQFLGISQDDLSAELQSGKSLGAIAEEKGIGDDKLAAKLQDGLAPDLKPIIWPPAPVAPEIKIVNPADDTSDS
jgi:hypothetical protein